MRRQDAIEILVADHTEVCRSDKNSKTLLRASGVGLVFKTRASRNSGCKKEFCSAQCVVHAYHIKLLIIKSTRLT